MISYEPFWKNIQERGISTYKLINKYGILPDTIQRLRDGRPITTKTLDSLCIVIACDVLDVLKFVPEEQSRITDKGR